MSKKNERKDEDLEQKEAEEKSEEEESDDAEDSAEDEDDGEDEEEEDEVEAARPQPSSRRATRARGVAGEADDDEADEDDDEEDEEDEDGFDDDTDEADRDPQWWTPYAVLGSLVLIGILGFFGVFNKPLGFLAAKPAGAPAPSAHAAASGAAPGAAATQPLKPRPSAQPRAPGQKRTGEFGAKHLLVQYKGSMRAAPAVVRTKEEAKARAEEALKKLKAGGAWAAAVTEYSDEPGAGTREGDLQEFDRGMMHPDFQKGLEATKVGQISDIVESPFGFHVIKRTK